MRPRAVAIAGTAALLALVSCRAGLEGLEERALDDLRDGDYADAEARLLELADRATAANDGIRARRAALHLGTLYGTFQVNPGKAEMYYRRAFERGEADPIGIKAREQLARLAYKRTATLPKAVALFQSLIDLQPRSPNAETWHYRVISGYFKSGVYSQVPIEAQAFLRRYPRSPSAAEVRLMSAQALSVDGHLAEARSLLEKMLAHETDDAIRARAEFELGGVLEDLGETDAALTHYAEALLLHPNPEAVRAKLEGLRQRLQVANRMDAEAAQRFSDTIRSWQKPAE